MKTTLQKLINATIWLAYSTVLANDYSLPGDRRDYSLVEGDPPTFLTGGTLGYVGTSGGGRNVVLAFELPVLAANERILSAQLSFRLNGTSGSPSFNGDLWGVAIQGNLITSVSPREFLEADTDDTPAGAGNVKLQDNILFPGMAAGTVTSSPDSGLAAYLQGFYDNNPNYSGGSYVFLRLNPDADAGTGTVRYSIALTESGNVPVLALTTSATTPTIYRQLQDHAVSIGGSVSNFVLVAGGVPPYDYQWYFNGVLMPGLDGISAVQENIQTNSAGLYFVVVRDADNQYVTSRVATLSVDHTFTQVTTGPLVQDPAGGMAGTWVDVDGDGWLDFYCAWAQVPGSSTAYCRLLRNNRDGTFTPIDSIITQTSAAGNMTAWGDYNNDGLPDLFVASSGNDLLFLNLGNFQFTQITTGPVVNDGVVSRDCVWVDYNRDGWLDLFVMVGNATAPAADLLYRNNGDGTFTKMTAAEVGSILGNVTGGWSAFWLDINDDGWPDLYRNIQTASAHYHQIDINDGRGFFYAMEIGSMTNGAPSGSVISWGDYNNNGFPDPFVGNYLEAGAFYRNLPGQDFMSVAGSGLPTESGNFFPSWGDFDNDGWLDALMVSAVGQPGFIYRNNGDGTFTKTTVSFAANPNPNYGASFAYWGDYDNDGFLDLLFAHAPQSPCALFRNNAGSGNHWLKVKLNGTTSNRMGIGAKVRVRATINRQTFWQYREIYSAQTYNNNMQYGCLAHFGLGDATNIDLVRIEWPSGTVQELTNVTANQLLTVTEADLPPSIATQPTDAVTVAGGSASFFMDIINSNAPYSLQWYHNGAALSAATQSSLTLPNVQATNGGSYYCILRDTNDINLTSRVARLSIIPSVTQITIGPLVEDQAGGMSGAWIDVNGDGLLDIYIGGAETPGSGTRYNRLLRNNGDGTFTPITNTITETSATGWYATWGDYNNDGLPDLFVSRSGNDLLFLNQGDFQFSQITTGPPVSDGVSSTSSIWIDYNRDGLLDLFVMATGVDLLYCNTGDGFIKMTAMEVGSILDNAVSGYSGFWLDINNDGWPDLYRNYSLSGARYHQIDTNNGQSFFYAMDIGNMSNGAPASSSIRWGDYNNDGFPDAFVFNYQAVGAFYLNLQGLGFTDVLAESGLPMESDGFLATWVDYDNDGWLDALMISAIGQPAYLYRNNGDGTFTKTSLAFPDNGIPGDGAPFGYCADYDNDGFMDVMLTHAPQSPVMLFRNDANNGNRWLKVKLNGTTSNRMGIGAKVRVRATINGQTFWQHREIYSAQTYNNNPQYGCLAHFGLGDATNIDLVRIEWPSGTVQELTNVTANQFLTVTEGTPPPSISTQPADVVATVGGTASFSLVVTNGNEPLSFLWYHDGAALTSATQNVLTLPNVQVSDSGNFYCIVTDVGGYSTTSRVARLAIIPSVTQITTGPLVQDAAGGVSGTWIDVNGDGFLDIYIGGAEVPGSGNPGSGTRYNRLLRNNGDGTFTPIINIITQNSSAGWYATWGDYNNDGLPDLFVSRGGNDLLFLNQGNFQFTQITTGPLVSDGVISFSSIWIDWNRDGWLDLFAMAGNATTPRADLLYRNDGGTFTKMTAAEVGSIISNVTGGWSGFWFDIDNNGWPDLYRNIETAGAHYHQIDLSDGAGRFVPMEIGSLTNGAPLGSTIAWGDYNNDGYPDAFVFKYPEAGAFYRNLRGQGFTNVLAESGLPMESGGFGAAWGDFDNDGWLDALMINAVGQPGFLYRNNGDGTFTKTSLSFPANPNSNFGASFAYWGDYDNDGFLDLLFAHAPQTPNSLYRNDANNGNRWLKVKLNGTASNRMGIGAKVRVQANINGRTFWQHREIYSAQTFNNNMQYGCLAHFGLGDATNIDLVRIEWPSGTVQEITNVVANQILTITEVLLPPSITTQPADIFAVAGGSASFLLVVTNGSIPISYLWHHEGAALFGATQSVLTLPNVQAADSGNYYCIVNDADGHCLTSRVAHLTLVTNPTIVAQPLNQKGVVGEMVTLSVAVTNTATLPIEYRWRRGSSYLFTNILDRHEDFFTVPVGSQASNYNVIVANLARPGGIVSALVMVSPVADLDADGLPDEWEATMGINTNALEHHLADDDGDGVPNDQEYRAGTCPTNQLSCLKVTADRLTDRRTIHFQAMSNKTYTVEYSSEVITEKDGNRDVWAPSAWFRLLDIPAAPADRSLEISEPVTSSNRFYRIITPRAP